MGASATGFPLNQPGLIAGTLSLATSGTVYNLMALIQAQLDANFTGVARDIYIQADASGTLYIGRVSPLGGALSSTNYGASLTSTSQPILLASSFPGSNAPAGDLQVTGSASPTTMHVIIQP